MNELSVYRESLRDINRWGKMKKFKSLPIHERPRKKLQQKGAKSLSDLELLVILLGSGTKDSDVMIHADRI